MRRAFNFKFILLLYVIIGIYVAWTHHYLTLPLLKQILSAVLVIFLWFLVILGLNLHVR